MFDRTQQLVDAADPFELGEVTLGCVALELALFAPIREAFALSGSTCRRTASRRDPEKIRGASSAARVAASEWAWKLPSGPLGCWAT
jgi:hypothetical protein